jgi:hypothetical protein
MVFMVEDLKKKIDKLSINLNNMLIYGIKKDEYTEVLKVSQELDILISRYTKLTLSQSNAD